MKGFLDLQHGVLRAWHDPAERRALERALGQIDQGGLFALGGIAVRDTHWPELRRIWQETLSAASP